MPADCLFCRIVAGEVPATISYHDEAVIAFADLSPQAPTHVLVVPREHLRDIGELAAHPQTAAAVLAGIAAVVEQLGVSSYRTVFNTGSDAHQTVFHVHAHVLAGRSLSWPPG